MPELPEVETVKAGLKALLPGLTVKSVEHNWEKSFPNSKANVDSFLVGAKIVDVRRRAKVLMIDLSSNYSLVIHLKMTGQLVFVSNSQTQEIGDRSSKLGEKSLTPNSKLQTPQTEIARFSGGHPTKSLVGELPDRSTRVTIEFEDGGRLFFNDQRKFGWMRLIPTAKVPNIDFMRKVGPEPLEQNFSADDFMTRLMRRKNSGIKAVLLDQSVIAGVGNIYADESLFAAGIHPSSIVSVIPKKKLKDLYTQLRAILNLSIKNGGTTDRNFVDAMGRKGNYMDIAKVFRREGQTCPVCGGEIINNPRPDGRGMLEIRTNRLKPADALTRHTSPALQTGDVARIIKIRVASRGTHICPKCQKLYKPTVVKGFGK